MKKQNRGLYIGLALLLVVCLGVGLFFAHQTRLDDTQREALEMLDANQGDYDEQRIVLTDTTHSEARALAERFGAKLRITKDGSFAALTLPEGVTIRDVYAARENRQYIEVMSPDFYAQASALEPAAGRPQYTVTDDGYGRQDYLDYLNLQDTWNQTKGSGVTVAIIDTGIDTDHPEFAGRISQYSYNATEDKVVKDYGLSIIDDNQGHGTAVTGVIAAAMDGSGIVGVAPQVQLLVIKVDCDASGRFLNGSDLVFGLYYAIEQDVDIVNMSFGVGVNIFADALRLAVDSDIICVAAAGNDGTTALSYPAADENALGVGALAENTWELAMYSNYGENVDVVAPGTTYTTALGGGYGTMTGTSLACPTVVGGLALYLSRNRYATFETVRENLYAACYDLGTPGSDWYYGYGALDVDAMVNQEKGTVTFHMLTEELENIEQLFVREHTLQDIPEPERLYAVFDGWYYDMDCIEPLNLYEDAFHGDLTLYAKWVNEDDGLPYTYAELDDGTIEITGYTGKRRYITLPEYIDGKVVSTIAAEAFAGNSRLREVTLPAQLKYVGERAFYGCNQLTMIQIPDSVLSIGSEAFADNVRLSAVIFGVDSRLQTIGSFAFKNCGNLLRFEVPGCVSSLEGSAFYGATGLRQFGILGSSDSFVVREGVLLNKSATALVAYPAAMNGIYQVPDGVKSVGSYAFAFARITGVELGQVESIGAYAFASARLEALTIPNSVTSLGGSAFAENSQLQSLKLGSGLRSIADCAFANAALLEKVTIPANIFSIEGNAFQGAGLTQVTFAAQSQLTVIVGGAFSKTKLTTVTIPATVTHLAGFDHCSNLESVYFAANSQLYAVSNKAFEDSSKLKTITLPNTVQSIGNAAFAGTGALESLVLPEGLVSIGSEAFSMSGLRSITLPQSLEKLGFAAFGSCHSLENILVQAGNPYFTAVDGVVYNKDQTVILAYPAGNSRTSYTVADTAHTVGSGAFYGSQKLTYVVLPSSVTTVEAQAFYLCSNVSSYSLSNQLVTIGQEAFSYNTKLSSIAIPDTVQQVGRMAFAHDYRLTSVSFSDQATLPRISYESFAYTGLQSFRVPASVSTMAQGAFRGCEDLTTVTFAANSKLESISAYLFEGCTKLGQIQFENGSALRSIQAHGFEGMTKLYSVDFGNAKLENIDNYAFRYCESLTTLPIPETVTDIGRYAFYGCKALERLELPAGLEHIGENAFYLAEKLDLFFLGDALPANLEEGWDNGIRGYYVGVKDIVENDTWRYAVLNTGKIAIIEYLGNEKTVTLTTQTFGGEVASIGGYAFYGKDITSITLPNTLKEIHRYAFAQTKLGSVKLPESVQFIGKYAFSGSSVSQVTGGTGLVTIEQYAFAGCAKLKSFTVPASLKNLGSYAFSKSGLESVNMSATTLTTIPEGAFLGSKLTSVTIPNSVTLIDHSAFRDCLQLKKVTFGTGQLQLMSNVFYNSGLTEVTIPDNLTYIGEYSFVGLRDLKEFKVSATHPKYQAIDGLLYSKDGKKLIAAPAGKTGTITLPQSLEVLGFGAFENSKLTKVSFHPDSNILTFGYRCFYNSALTEITVPASVVSFDYYAFAMCQDLTTVTFAEGTQLKGIYEGAFYGCLKLENIRLPESIVEISDYAFYGCRALTDLPVAEDAQLKGIYDYAFAFSGITELNLPDSLVDIGAYAFRGLDITDLTIPDANAKNLIIGIGAFADCNRLESMTLPFIGASFEDEQIGWLGYLFGAGSAGAGDTYIPESLKTLTLTEGVRKLMKGAIDGNGLQQVYLPDTLTDLYAGAWLTSARHEYTNTMYLYMIDDRGQTEPYYWVNPGVIGSGLVGQLKLGEGPWLVDMYTFQDETEITAIILPDSITSIGDYAFSGCSGLESLVIPDGVQEIAEGTFAGCSSLRELTLTKNLLSIGEEAFLDCVKLELDGIPDTVTSIGERAFKNCESIRGMNVPEGVTDILRETFLNCKSLETVTLPSTLEEIGYNAFQNCSSLMAIDLPDGVTSISDYAFSGCSSMASLQLPSGLSQMGYYVFEGCGMEKVEIPAGRTSVGYGAFSDCTALREVILPDTIERIDTVAFWGCTSLETIQLPEGLTEIGSGAFSGCTGLKGITLPSSLTELSGSAFSRCTSLESISIPGSVTHIQDSTFYGCSSLSDLHFGEGVLYLSDSSFRECTSLTQVTLPDSLTHIYYSVFQDCTDLQSITLGKGLLLIGNGSFTGCGNLFEVINNSNLALSIQSGYFYGANNVKLLINADGSREYKNGEEVTFLDTVDGFRFSVQEDTYRLVGYFGDEETITLPEYANGHTYYVDRPVGNFKHVTIPSTVTVGKEAFLNNKKLVSVVFAEGSTWIGDYAFYGCSNLESVKLPDSMEKIENFSFAYTRLQSIEISPNHPYYRLENGLLLTVDRTELCAVLSSVEDAVIPATVTYLAYTMRDHDNLRTVTFEAGSKLSTVGDYAFEDCDNLTSVQFTGSLNKIGSYAFQNCTSLETVILPEGLRTIEHNAFYNCTSLKSIQLPAGLQSLDSGAFNYCSSLEALEIPCSMTSLNLQGCSSLVRLSAPAGITGLYLSDAISLQELILSGGIQTLSISGAPLTELTVPDGVTKIILNDCDQLTELVLPESVQSIRIEYCAALKKVNVPSGTTSIYFEGCSSLESVTIPSSMTTLTRRIFYGCSSLRTVVIPEGVTEIGEYAFYGCSSLEELILPASVTTIRNYAFAGAGITSIVIPDTVTNMESAYVFADCTRLVSVKLPASLGGIWNGMFSGCTSLKNIEIPAGVAYIGNNSFQNCDSLETITIPAGVASIGESAFSSCESLEEVILPEGLTTLSRYAFWNCTSLKDIVLPISLNTVADYALSNCTSLNRLEIPDGLYNIGSTAFVGSNIYIVVDHSGYITSISSTDYGYLTAEAKLLICADGSYVFPNDGSRYVVDGDWAYELRETRYGTVYYLDAYFGTETEIVLPDGLDGEPYILGDYIFAGSNITSVTFSDSVTEIGYCAFAGCKALTTVKLSTSVTTIGSGAFANCTGLTEIEIPDGVTTIDYEAFAHCTGLTEIEIPDSVTSIWSQAFKDCTNLRNVSFPEQYILLESGILEGTAYYNEESNWRNGCLYVGSHLLAIPENVEDLVEIIAQGSVVQNLLDYCYRLRIVAAGPWNYSISNLSNLETLVLTGRYDSVLVGYLGWNPPMTLKNVILQEGFQMATENMFTGISGVTIFVEAEKTAVQWDHDYPGWNNGNTVYYGGEWIRLRFEDVDGTLIDLQYQPISGIIRQPYVANKTEGEYIHVFVGWDIDGDGQADAIPATSQADITAVAVYETHRPGEAELHGATCTENGYSKTVCLDCGETVEYKVLKATGHTSGGYIQTVAPGCETQGYEIHRCDTCGEDFHKNFTEPTGHSYGVWTPTKGATCTSTGSHYHVCAVCSHREDEIIPLAEHKYTSQELKAASCTSEGQIKYTCQDCGYEYIAITERTPHHYAEHKASQSFLEWMEENAPDALVLSREDGCYYYQCEFCDHIMQQSQDGGSTASIAAAGCKHQLGDWTLVRAPSGSDPAIEARICDLCGDMVELRTNSSPTYLATFKTATATLDGKIGLNYYLTIEESVASDPEARMVFILNGNRTEVPISEAKVDNQGRYRFTIRLAASEMADIVQAQMFVGDTPISKIQEYSLQKYASYRISNTTDEVERELMIAMLNYGAVSQVHFNHNVENLANSVLEEQLRGVPEVTAQDLAGYATVMSGTADGIKPKSATLLLQSGTSIRVYFQLTGTKTIDQYSFTIDGQPAIPIEKDGSYYLEVSSVPAAELGDTHVFTCDGITIEYSALTYVEVMLRTSSKADIIDMVRGVYGYNIAAKAFFGK